MQKTRWKPSSLDKLLQEPGPRDREGLPDSLRFWKTRIEETDPDNTFSVGLIYGPSGCGKSSLVKAGKACGRSTLTMPTFGTILMGWLSEPIPTDAAEAAADPTDVEAGVEACVSGCGFDVDRDHILGEPRQAARQKGRREHRLGASPASVRWGPGAVHRDGAG